jgi:hypothetical protein
MESLTVTVVTDDGLTGSAIINLTDPGSGNGNVSVLPPPTAGYFPLTSAGDFPVPAGDFDTLPDDAAAASMVRRSIWEPRPENAVANAARPPADWVAPPPSPKTNPYPKKVWDRVTGACPLTNATTDELIQWCAAKWGLSDAVIRAQMVQETKWYQDLKWSDSMPVGVLADFALAARPNACPIGTPVFARGYGDYAPGGRNADGSPMNTHGSPNILPGQEYNQSLGGTLIDGQYSGNRVNGPESFGLPQCRWFANTSPGPTGFGCYPYTELCTSVALDVYGATVRAQYEGWNSWQHGGYDTYKANPGGNVGVWGSVGNWYSGGWNDKMSQPYVANVKAFLESQPWLQVGF